MFCCKSRQPLGLNENNPDGLNIPGYPMIEWFFSENCSPVFFGCHEEKMITFFIPARPCFWQKKDCRQIQVEP
jgi:hypothetical protein